MTKEEAFEYLDREVKDKKRAVRLYCFMGMGLAAKLSKHLETTNQTLDPNESPASVVREWFIKEGL